MKSENLESRCWLAFGWCVVWLRAGIRLRGSLQGAGWGILHGCTSELREGSALERPKAGKSKGQHQRASGAQ
jgi:hypothetical protein